MRQCFERARLLAAPRVVRNDHRLQPPRNLALENESFRCNFLPHHSSHLSPQVRNPPAGAKSTDIQGEFMKRLLSSLMLTCVLTLSMAAFAQDQMKQDDMKKDDAKQDTMKNDQMKKDKKSKKAAKKDAMKKDDMKKDNMKDDNMKKDDMKKDEMKNN
jgi:pentapeptide MXKDX repeat protein